MYNIGDQHIWLVSNAIHISWGPVSPEHIFVFMSFYKCKICSHINGSNASFRAFIQLFDIQEVNLSSNRARWSF